LFLKYCFTKTAKLYEQGLNRDFNNEEEEYHSEFLMLFAMRREMMLLRKAVKEIQHAMDEKEQAKTSPEKKLVMMNSAEVTKTLKISDRTLYNYRKKGTLRCTKIGGKCLYAKADIEQLLKQERD